MANNSPYTPVSKYISIWYIWIFIFLANSLYLKNSGSYRKVREHLLKTFSRAALVIKACQSFSAFPATQACTVNLLGTQSVRVNEIWQLIDVRCSIEFGNPITSFPFKAEVIPVNMTPLTCSAIQSERLHEILLFRKFKHKREQNSQMKLTQTD